MAPDVADQDNRQANPRRAAPLPSDVVAALKVKTAEVLADGAAKDPTTKKVHESFMSFKKKHDSWKGLSEAGFMKAVNG